MVMTYENLLRLSDFQWQPCKKLANFNSFNFLSFQDALHYLIKAYQLQGKKILIPAYYCEATINDMENHGLSVHLCKIDTIKFDIDLFDFKVKLQSEQPDVVLIYNIFGKRSHLYDDIEWRQLLKTNAILISDFAHSLIPQHEIEFLNDRHFYIDSTRKTTCRMMAHLIMPKKVVVNTKLVIHYSLFKFAMRALFFLKSWSLRLATFFNLKIFSDLGMWFYYLHDKYIGSPKCAFTAFRWDSFLYKRINFEKIKYHRELLYNEYNKKLQNLVTAGYIEVFDISKNQHANLCFFFVRIVQQHQIAPLLKLLQQNGFWAEVLWNFDEIKNLSLQEREWAKSIAVMPYTVRTKIKHINFMVSIMETYFNSQSQQQL